MRGCFLAVFLFTIYIQAHAQVPESTQIRRDLVDSLYIEEVENRLEPAKVLHAEPLFIDLIRDLGARKGEKEWNVGLGLTDNNRFDEYGALIEYEWAPINRLGLEVELPFSFYYPVTESVRKNSIPRNKLHGLKLAAQYSFFVSEQYKTTLALGYIHEFEVTDFRSYGRERFYSGNVYNPFFVAAKRWGKNFHTLLYTGPQVLQHFAGNKTHTSWQINSNLHYMIDGTRNFIGVEFNKELHSHDFDMVIRPQMRVGIADNLLVGIVTGIPISRENQRFSSFIRLIYEPGHRHVGQHK